MKYFAFTGISDADFANSLIGKDAANIESLVKQYISKRMKRYFIFWLVEISLVYCVMLIWTNYTHKLSLELALAYFGGCILLLLLFPLATPFLRQDYQRKIMAKFYKAYYEFSEAKRQWS